MNYVLITGNIGNDPDVKTFNDNKKVVTFSVASSKSFKDNNNEWQQETEWSDIQCWGYLAEKAEKIIKKGGFVVVQGEKKTRNYKDKNGVKRYVTDIVARTIEIPPSEYVKSESSGNFPTPSEDDMPF